MLVLPGAAVYLYLSLFALPRTPFLLGGDQVFFWLDAQRMLSGQRIYQDFLQFTPPGTDYLYLAIFKLFGFRIWVTNAAVLALGVAFCWICFSLARDLVRRGTAVLVTALFLVLVYTKALNATHHWFSVLAIMAAVKNYFSGVSARSVALSGALVGLAAFFNQAHGAAALAAFAVFLVWSGRRQQSPWTEFLKGEGMLLLGFALAFAAASAHEIAVLGLRQLWYFQVTYVTKYVVNLSQGGLLGLPKSLGLKTLPALAPYLVVYAMLPVIYVVTLWRCYQNRRDLTFQWDRLALLSLIGIFLLAEVTMSLNWLRLFAVSLPAFVLFGPLIHSIKLRPQRLTLVWIVILAVGVRQTFAMYRSQSLRVSLPGGRAAINPLTYEKLREIMQRTTPGEYFFQAGWPGVYLPLQLRNPLYLDLAYAARPEEATRVVQQLQTTNVPYILWSEHLDQPCRADRPCGDGVALLRDYLHRSYVRVHVFSDGDTLWQSQTLVR